LIFLTYIFIALAAVCNAFMDKIENSIQFNNSIFRNLNPEFWCKTISAHSTKFIPFTKYRPDAWHIAKSWMIVFFISSIPFYSPFIENFLQPFTNDSVIVGKTVFIILGGVLYNLTFNLFYNNVFKSKL